jgi:hypothetical protein
MRRLILIALAVSLLLSGARTAQAQMLWDDFKAKKLDPAKWFLGDQLFLNGARALELRREISGGKLLLSHRAVGSNDTGALRGFSSNRLFLFTTTPLRSFQADVKITAFNTTECSDTGTSVISFEQWNRLFNTTSIDADTTGACAASGCDVYAKFFIEHSLLGNGPTLFDIRARVWAQPVDSNGVNSGPEIPIADQPIGASAGSIKKGQTIKVTWVWDEANHTVTFQTNQKNVLPVIVDYGVVGPTNPLPFLFNNLETDVFPCNSADVPGNADLSVSIDKIIVTQ